MLDRVREAMFSSLLPWIPDARVLDLFAGSGSLGLEAVSRGAALARMVEEDPGVLRVLERNVAALDLGRRAEIVPGDALDPGTWLRDAEPGFDVVFLDPPYPVMRDLAGRKLVLGRLAQLVRSGLAKDGVLVLHVPRDLLGPGDWEPGLVFRERSYGSSSLFYVQPDEEPEDEGTREEERRER